MVLFHPKGPVGESERLLIIVAFILMLIVVIPVIVMALWFPLKYRASNTKATYDPKWYHSRRIEVIVWVIPLAIVLVLSVLTWRETHRLDPYRPLNPGTKQLRIQAISLDWKWLFIYPDQGIAVVNELVFPAKVPLRFELTSDTVMTSFFIPQLGSQIYAMAGMRTQLHLLADIEGTFIGQNQQYSGEGFSFMSFKAIATSPEGFEAWVAKVRQSPHKLDMARLDALRKPSMKDPVTFFSSVEPGLFVHLMRLYDPKAGSHHAMGNHAPAAHATTGDTEER